MYSIEFAFLVLARFALIVLAGIAVIAGTTTATLAQNQNCTQIASIMRSIEKNQTFASYNGIAQELANRQRQVQQAEQQWLNGGCQQIYNSGQALPSQCRALAQTITSGRDQVRQLQSMAQEGQKLARNYEALSQDYERYNCTANGRGNLLDNMFGGNAGPDYFTGDVDPWSRQQTRRTVCVRTCDGFYWPISFSTVDEYIDDDAISCHEMCPGTEVALFSYRNPGEEPEDMISLSGTPYRSMPYAFRFRQEIDTDCSCKTGEPVGRIASVENQGQSRLMIDFGDLDFPLPQPDPRGAPVETIVAEADYVPLPRPRPRDDGTALPVAAQPRVEGPRGMRIVDFGDREVRIVGPETPYVPEEEEES